MDRYALTKEVTDAEKIGWVKEIFSTVFPKYDFLNHVLSLRRDIAWRRFAVRKMRFFRTYRLIDVATGTGDLAIEAALFHPSIEVTGIDFVREMMELGQAKIVKKKLSGRIRLLQGDALHLPFGEGKFDAAAIAFGIRNIPDRMGALKEMARVVVPGGQVMVLEMTYPRRAILRSVYGVYLYRVLPSVARRFSRNPEAYRYLADSIVNFPSPEMFSEKMEEAGLVEIKRYALTLGVTYLHVGRKPPS
jgi:demethylmenaquinone methyltransferase/2-methoxy-6-polyprenyl-1,4-benzoquinol methylase